MRPTVGQCPPSFLEREFFSLETALRNAVTKYRKFKVFKKYIHQSFFALRLILNVGLQQTLVRQLCFDWLLAIDSYWGFKSVLNKRSNFYFAQATWSELCLLIFLSSQSFLISSFLCLTSTLFFIFYICYFLYSYPCPPIRSLRFSSFMFLYPTLPIIISRDSTDGVANRLRVEPQRISASTAERGKWFFIASRPAVGST